MPPSIERVGAFPIETGSRDAVFLGLLSPGAYTVLLTAKPGHSGTALIEIYEDDNEADRMLNLSTRAMVTPGSPVIAGLSIRGPATQRVLIRAVGPGLADWGVNAALANPALLLKDERGATIAGNDDWETNATAADLRQVMSAAGAFPLAAGSRDAALLVTLAPGNYTALVEGAAASSGIVLLEIYDVP